MRNKVLLAFIAALIILIPQNKAYAYREAKASQSSASIHLPESMQEVKDNRVKILEQYLKEQGSPLTPYAKDFVFYADKYKLDWKLVAAISGVESTFGQQIPPYSYNGWGWGVYGDNVIRFTSWTDGIKTVSQGLRERYIDQRGAEDVYQIGSTYASSPFWATHVSYYMGKISDFQLRNPKTTLSLSL